jgi:hypothetical protein
VDHRVSAVKRVKVLLIRFQQSRSLYVSPLGMWRSADIPAPDGYDRQILTVNGQFPGESHAQRARRPALHADVARPVDRGERR